MLWKRYFRHKEQIVFINWMEISFQITTNTRQTLANIRLSLADEDDER